MLDLERYMVYNGSEANTDMDVNVLLEERGRHVDWIESTYSEMTAVRLARAGALVRVVCASNACDVCKALADRAYSPSEVPRLPIRGCRNEQCRCRFEAVDPESKLAVSELVARAIQAVKAGHKDIAHQILERVVSLDEKNEQGWLWMSAVVPDNEKIVCLEKVLSINPDHSRARAGLISVRQKLGTSRLVAELDEKHEPKPEPEPDSEAAALAEALASMLPAELGAVRAEREVIAEQWGEFLAFAAQVDPAMLRMQGEAFLQKLQRLNQQALDVLARGNIPPQATLDELDLQWQESEDIGEALAQVIEEHQARDHSAPNWQSMLETLRDLARDVLAHRSGLRQQIAETGGQAAQ